MVIADFYKNIHKQLVNFFRAGEPVCVLGMCESGKNLCFRYTCKQLAENWDRNSELFFLDLVGSDAAAGNLHLHNAFSNKFTDIPVKEINTFFIENYPHKKIFLVINADEVDENNLPVFLSLVNLRTIRGTSFVYAVFGYINVYRQIFAEKALAEMQARKVLRLLPLEDNDALTMITRNEQLFKITLSAKQKEQVVIYSGGNPGLLKTLVMQVGQNPGWGKPDLQDNLLQWRIKRMFFGLSAEQLAKLADLSAYSEDDPDYKLFLDFGYIRRIEQMRHFSPLVPEFIDQTRSIDPDIYLTDIESKILHIFRQEKGGVITREKLAELIWGENFLHHYSDYALDKHISNLRKKLQKINYPLEIQTLKGRGFLAAK